MALTLTLADYARIMPLATGAVAMEGTPLNVVTGRQGSWPDRASLLSRALNDPAVDAGEGSMGLHLARIGRGDRRFIGLPVLPFRNFTSPELYVTKGQGFQTAKDLIGKRMGMYSWNAIGSIWYRHFLRWCGVEADQVQWLIGDVDVPQITQAAGFNFPPHVKAAPSGQALSELLIAGEIDALYSPPRPIKYHPAEGPIVRLISDIRGTEMRYFAETKVYPPQHLVVMRRDIWEKDKSIARRLTDAFIRSNEYFEAQQRSFPYVTPWHDLENELIPARYHADGL